MGANTSSDRVNEQADEAQRGWKSARVKASPRDLAILTKLASNLKAARVGGSDRDRAFDQVRKLADKRIQLLKMLDHSDFNVRQGARELLDRNLAEIQKFSRPDVIKAHSSGEDAIAVAIRTAVNAGVAKVMADLSDPKKR
ncbi:MAG: hypothetical protein ACHQ0J_01295 [Candidatus Dormibacterales bacterium]